MHRLPHMSFVDMAHYTLQAELAKLMFQDKKKPSPPSSCGQT